MSIVFWPLYSGSTGNACFVATENTRVLVDAGMPGTELARALNGIGCDPSTLDGILVTHEHVDHIRGLGVLARRYGIKIYANSMTWTAINLWGKCGVIPERCRIVYNSGCDFALGDFWVTPLAISHDAADPSGYLLDQGSSRVGIATDTGVLPQRVLEQLGGAGAVLLESNHDIDLLKANPAYPAALKQRILGKKGHLSNAAAAQAAVSLVRMGVPRLALGHLSQQNNTPELAFDTTALQLALIGAKPGKDVELALTWPDKPGKPWTV